MKRSNWGKALLMTLAIIALTIIFIGLYEEDSLCAKLLVLILTPFALILVHYRIPLLLVGVVVFLILWGKWRERQEKKVELRINQQKQKSEGAEIIDPDSTILYLRPFKADANDVVSVRRGGERTVKHSWWKKRRNRFDAVRYAGKDYSDIEALICDMLRDCGVPIAIGDPRERTLDTGVEDGAARVYVDEAVWKEKVEDYFRHARLVVLYVDFTEGVTWEISRAVEQYAEKTVFLPKLYNKHGMVVSFLSVSTYLLFTWPILLFRRLLLFPHVHRGLRYYREWKRIFPFSITDRAAAIRIVDGKPMIYETRNGLLESQLSAILAAVQSNHS